LNSAQIHFRSGIHIDGLDFWLDSTRIREFGYVSHAHSDHSARHKRILGSLGTVRLFQHRYGEVDAMGLPFGERRSFGDFAVSLLPSGHVLGGSQIVLDGERRIVYTGDFKVEPNEAAEPIEIPKTDVLIMECTYGKPQYVFPKKDEVTNRLVEFVETSFKRGAVPVVFAYSLGKSQEVMKILGDLGYSTAVHHRAFEFAEIYEELGLELRNYEEFTGEADGKVLVLPPFRARAEGLAGVGRYRSAIVTGWALDPGCRFKFNADVAIPMSDHADFNELLSYVNQAEPRKIYCLHGDTEFVRHLKRRGHNAVHVKSGEQLCMWDDL
jgi:Cft2 family RNA processing exonuclease